MRAHALGGLQPRSQLSNALVTTTVSRTHIRYGSNILAKLFPEDSCLVLYSCSGTYGKVHLHAP